MTLINYIKIQIKNRFKILDKILNIIKSNTKINNNKFFYKIKYNNKQFNNSNKVFLKYQIMENNSTMNNKLNRL